MDRAVLRHGVRGTPPQSVQSISAVSLNLQLVARAA